ncbi:diphosphomevalonate decarboxylase [Longilinea arvoryzae]|uniref:diphosphomevalonate decarboxylase n=1 Tax=Longilinea arvoryzae TaxID=360412 RepID=A0A0S7BIT9_9CHLR|nr:diphosphomevalonate decarboxylase [Longilinea arvoryzae]GAP15072.1 diphosphomevalonate decarboxylase [Longilinea arvoryzae]
MSSSQATAIAHPNIAFIKYWGNRDSLLRLPANGSISMNLGGLETRTTIEFSPEFSIDTLVINLQPVYGAGLERVVSFLDRVRGMAGQTWRAHVSSNNNFPTGAGIASSAAAFAALSLAASHAIGLNLDEAGLSRLARTGSGSACRSVPGGFVEWKTGSGDADSYAVRIAPPQHWALVDHVAIVRAVNKPVGSTEGHALAGTSPLQAARVADTLRRIEICRDAILNRDFSALTRIIEQDSNLMHAVMMTSQPALFYWEPASIALMKSIPVWRQEGLNAAYTLDAGPNVHIISPAQDSAAVQERLNAFPGVKSVLVAPVGGPARLASGAEE